MMKQRSALLDLLFRVNDLKALPRTGWLLAGVVDAESVADHSCSVALCSLFLAEAINADLPAQQLAEPLDIQRVVIIALIHDLAESVLTDLPRRSTAVIGQEIKQQAEQSVLRVLFADLPGADQYELLWQEYVSLSSPEAQLVKDVDRLELVIQALRYAERGHRNLDEFWEGHRWHYTICQELFQSLLDKRLP